MRRLIFLCLPLLCAGGAVEILQGPPDQLIALSSLSGPCIPANSGYYADAGCTAVCEGDGGEFVCVPGGGGGSVLPDAGDVYGALTSLTDGGIAWGTLGVAGGGTGITTLTGLPVGNGTGAFTSSFSLLTPPTSPSGFDCEFTGSLCSFSALSSGNAIMASGTANWLVTFTDGGIYDLGTRPGWYLQQSAPLGSFGAQYPGITETPYGIDGGLTDTDAVIFTRVSLTDADSTGPPEKLVIALSDQGGNFVQFGLYIDGNALQAFLQSSASGDAIYYVPVSSTTGQFSLTAFFFALVKTGTSWSLYLSQDPGGAGSWYTIGNTAFGTGVTVSMVATTIVIGAASPYLGSGHFAGYSPVCGVDFIRVIRNGSSANVLPGGG